MRNFAYENEFDLHENYIIIKCEDAHNTSICRYVFSVLYLLDTVKQDGGLSLMRVLMLTAARSRLT